MHFNIEKRERDAGKVSPATAGRAIKMKPAKLYWIGLTLLLAMTAPHQSLAQMANFYTSPNYNNFVNNLISNHIWNSSMSRYTGLNPNKGRGSSGASTSNYSSQPVIEGVPEYRKYSAVQFKSTGTRLTLQEYLDAVQINPQDKAELKQLVLDIFKKWEAAATAKGLPNDWALAYVSYVGLNSLVYNGSREKPIIPFEQNVGLRDLVAEYATDKGIFNNVSDREKQQLYELYIIGGGLTYHFYEKALRENNAEELKQTKQLAANNLKVVGIKP